MYNILSHILTENAVEEVNLDDFPYLLADDLTYMNIVLKDQFVKEALRSLGAEKLKVMNDKWIQLKREETQLHIKKTQPMLLQLNLAEAELYLKKLQLCQKHLKIVKKAVMKTSSNN